MGFYAALNPRRAQNSSAEDNICIKEGKVREERATLHNKEVTAYIALFAQLY
jgi:hypothetical protein